MLVWVLLLFFITMLIWSYIHYRKDLFHPSVLFCMAYTFTILCAIYNLKTWNLDIGWQTFCILLLGAIEFLLIDLIVTSIFRKKFKTENKKVIPRRTIHVPIWRTTCFIVFDIIMLALTFYEVFNIALQVGSVGSLSEILGAYRLHTSYRTDFSLSPVTRHLLKFMTVGAYVFLFLFINNFIYSNKPSFLKKIKTNVILLVPIILYIIQCLITSDRGSILRILISGVILSMVLWNNRNNWDKFISLKKILIMSIGAIGVLILFFFSATLIGRDTASKDLIGYVTLYAGGSVENLDLFLKDPNSPKPTIPGSETFSNLIQDMSKYGIIKEKIKLSNHLEFRYANGTTTGNVYTAYRGWYNDFGYVGMFILQGGLTLFFSVFYNLLHYKRNTKHQMTYILLLIFYGYMSYTLVLHSVSTPFYNSFVAVGFIMLVFIAIGEYYFLTFTKQSNTKIKKKVITIKNNLLEKLP